MGLVEAVKTCWQKSFVTEGRASRSEYWYWFLFVVVVGISLVIIEKLLGWKSAPLGTLFYCVQLPATLCVSIRRMHDRNISNRIVLLLWTITLILDVWGIVYPFPSEDMINSNPQSVLPALGVVVLGMVPFILASFVFVWHCFKKGTKGDNRFGPDPLAEPLIGA